MKRRSFLQHGLAGAALATTAAAAGQQAPHPFQQAARHEAQSTPATPQAPAPVREFYLLRRYHLARAQAAGCDRYLEQALLPALVRLRFPESGVFSLEYGPETPSTYLLLRHHDPSQLLGLDETLAGDPAYVAAAAPFRAAPVSSPAFDRISSTLLRAFTGWPVLHPPPRIPRILQLRTYESQSEAAHLRKIEMFHSGEFDIFAQCGMHQVFYGQTLVGDRAPSLTYLLSHDSLADMDLKWDHFRNNPGWKKLSTLPRFSDEDLVSNITNLVLTPKPYSQL